LEPGCPSLGTGDVVILFESGTSGRDFGPLDCAAFMDATLAASLASLWAFVVKLILTLFMPDVKLSTSKLTGASVGEGTMLLDLDGGSTGPVSFNGDFRRTTEGFRVSTRDGA
jgi:hypothetical protein